MFTLTHTHKATESLWFTYHGSHVDMCENSQHKHTKQGNMITTVHQGPQHRHHRQCRTKEEIEWESLFCASIVCLFKIMSTLSFSLSQPLLTSFSLISPCVPCAHMQLFLLFSFTTASLQLLCLFSYRSTLSSSSCSFNLLFYSPQYERPDFSSPSSALSPQLSHPRLVRFNILILFKLWKKKQTSGVNCVKSLQAEDV